jgi:SAM-dependent methyltransferase
MISGVKHIVRFNWTFYAGATMTVAVILWTNAHMKIAPPLHIALVAAAVVISFWTVASLLASWLVYDRSDLTQWQWIPEVLGCRPRAWLNVHAGLDDTSAALKGFLGGTGRVFDIFDPAETTEPSIARARAVSHTTIAAQHVDYRRLPAADDSIDAAFLLLAAHELRSDEARLALFTELRRLLRREGRIVVAEHLRDAANWAAFGPGALHFHSRRTWTRGFDRAGLVISGEFSKTPFVRIFVLRRAG